MELPPRARRIQDALNDARKEAGTTSACAENTHALLENNGASWNYLRVRGEYKHVKDVMVLTTELPPRARRIPPRGALRGPDA